MRIKLFLSSLLTALIPLSATADVTLHLNDNVELLAYNGKSHSASLFGSPEPVILNNGTQQLAFRYVDSFEEGKDVSFVRSDVIVVKFEASDTDVHFELPSFQTKRQARQFNKNPEFSLKDSSDNAIPFEQGKLLKSGFQLTRDYVSELQFYNQSDKPASLRIAAATTKSAPKPIINTQAGETAKNTGDTINEVEYQLHYWFAKADAETKAKFKAFVNTQ